MLRLRMCGCAVVVLWLGSGLAQAQLSDLQPGRNFPTAVLAFGSGRSESIDIGDVDNDGDFDVGVGNGGDGSAQQNRLFINQGNLQAGLAGTFTDETATRFAGVTVDTSRDVEFVDVDDDHDLDVYVTNRGSNTVGEVSRNYTNLGGRQFGTIGFFSETTDSFWGQLVSVPASDEVPPVDSHGPWRSWACDCDFGDLDDDGDLDLFHSTYGPGINGTTDHHVFLNSGMGVFDELWPWANTPTADIKTEALNIDLADLDGDYDLDVFNSSRTSQARLFRNDLGPAGWGGSPFVDVTATAFPAGSLLIGSSNYDSEFADLDGDGDFDVWCVNYANFNERILRNDGNLVFGSQPSWIGFDANVDDHEVDFLDYDSDGDLDAFAANFSGTNSIYQSGLADGGAPNLYTRCGQGTASLEAPASNNGGTSLDGECADLDGDGDQDILIGNDAGQGNRLWLNVLGVPDTHAPAVLQFTQQGDKADGSDTVIHAQVRDNAAHYVIDTYLAFLVYTVDGGSDENAVRMSAQGGQQFRGVIPGGVDGLVAYHIEVMDDAGNTGASGVVSYVQTSSGAPLWEVLGQGTPGFDGRRPELELRGTQLAGALTEFLVQQARPSSLALAWLSFASTPLNAIGGVVYAAPFNAQVPFATDTGGTFYASLPWPAGMPVGIDHTWQVFVADAATVHGITMSNAVHGVTP